MNKERPCCTTRAEAGQSDSMLAYGAALGLDGVLYLNSAYGPPPPRSDNS